MQAVAAAGLGQDGSIRRLDQGGTVVGLMDGMHYAEDSFHMLPGDILVAYSTASRSRRTISASSVKNA